MSANIEPRTMRWLAPAKIGNLAHHVNPAEPVAGRNPVQLPAGITPRGKNVAAVFFADFGEGGRHVAGEAGEA